MSQPHDAPLRVRGVIFDADGTLADSIEHYYWLACDIVERAGHPCLGSGSASS